MMRWRCASETANPRASSTARTSAAFSAARPLSKERCCRSLMNFSTIFSASGSTSKAFLAASPSADSMRMKYSICWSSGSRPRAEDAARAMDTAVSVSPLPCHHARTAAVINSLGVTPKQLLKFVEKHGIVLQAARGPVPSLAEHITGEPIKGSWWGHAKGHEIFELLSRVSEHPDVLVCKL